jgi:hypothetical protein
MVVFQVSRKGKETGPQPLDTAAFLHLSPEPCLRTVGRRRTTSKPGFNPSNLISHRFANDSPRV